jgi:MFS family permease
VSHPGDPAAPEPLHAIGGRRAWLIWTVALSVYVLAVFNRSSLGVAGLLAAERFDIAATQLAFFSVLQLVVYAGLQVPVGVLLDRFGSRAMLLVGLALLVIGQVGFAFSASFPAAVAARAVLGAGDAMIFVSVLRLVSAWFLVRQSALVTQLTGQIGQLGAIIAAAPLSLALHHLGWTRTFGLGSAVGILLMVAVALGVTDSPYPRKEPVLIKMRALAGVLRSVWGNPGTRLGMWSHFTPQFSATVFALLWGFPFLVSGQGLSTQTASTLLMVMTGWIVVSGLLLARVVRKLPYYRSWIVVAIVAAIAVTWAAVLLWPGQAPLWLLVTLVCVTGTGGPASMVGFDLARSFTPDERLGRATGMVNVGGFLASLLTIALIGLVLDLREPDGMAAYGLDDYKAAMSVQYVFWVVGVVQVLRYRRKGLRHLARVHPGAIESMRRGNPFVHPGDNGV